eukprot:1149653-Pelagomonas_calceolata.AAC.5
MKINDYGGGWGITSGKRMKGEKHGGDEGSLACLLKLTCIVHKGVSWRSEQTSGLGTPNFEFRLK